MGTKIVYGKFFITLYGSIYYCMRIVYLLIGVAILIVWIGSTVLITLVVIGFVGLIVYALKKDNKTIQEPLANRSNIKDSKPIATTTPIKPKECFMTPIFNDSFIECNQNMIGNEDVEDGTEPKDVLCVSEQYNNTDISVMLAKEEEHISPTCRGGYLPFYYSHRQYHRDCESGCGAAGKDLSFGLRI